MRGGSLFAKTIALSGDDGTTAETSHPLVDALSSFARPCASRGVRDSGTSITHHSRRFPPWSDLAVNVVAQGWAAAPAM